MNYRNNVINFKTCHLNFLYTWYIIILIDGFYKKKKKKKRESRTQKTLLVFKYALEVRICAS